MLFQDEIIVKLSDYYGLSREEVEVHIESMMAAFEKASEIASSAEDSEFGQINANDILYEEVTKLKSPKLAFQLYGQIVAITMGM